MNRLRLSWLVVCYAAWGLVGGALAQKPEPVAAQVSGTAMSVSSEQLDVPEEINRLRQDLAAQREVIVKSDEQRQVLCWQKFAVNACLTETRRIRRQALDLLAQQELVLNAREREWRSAQREQRLLGKQPENRATP